ncbi:MAG: hypothetical protein MUF15_16215 [Acidobacteria bacterium]|jgi:acetyltransferase-like isoleucine patch superfamily enzyme|nr:hypothetical protein [Acidobacteriota bacterium]
MKKYKNKSPEDVMKMVTTEIIIRGLKLGRKKKRTLYLHKRASDKGVSFEELNPLIPEGKERLEKFLTPFKRIYTISGLGAPEEKNALNWRKLNYPFFRRAWYVLLIAISFFLKGNAFKNRFYRWMGIHIGKNTEIMQMVWLDHFRPELIFIGDNTLLGAFTRLSVHAYEGQGKFRYGLIEIGSNCILSAGTGTGPIKIEDNVRTLPNTILSPYFLRIRQGSIVGWNQPAVKSINLENMKSQ